MARRPQVYDPSPLNVGLPLTLSEAESVAVDGGAAVRNAKVSGHYTARVVVTMRQHLEVVRQLHARLEAANARVNATTGRASTLNPVDAVRYLTPDQRADLCQGLVRDQYAAASADRAQAAAELAAARRVAAELRLVLLRLSGDRTVPDDARAQVQRALEVLDHPELAADWSLDSAPTADVPVAGSDAETLGDLFGDELVDSGGGPDERV